MNRTFQFPFRKKSGKAPKKERILLLTFVRYRIIIKLFGTETIGKGVRLPAAKTNDE